MEFFRNNQKTIILVIAASFVFMTVLPVIASLWIR